MTVLLLEQISIEGFSITPSDVDGTVCVAIKGSLDGQTLPLFDTYLKALHSEALRLRVKEVVFNCRDLYFLNSMSIKRFATWLAEIQKLEDGERYGVAFRTNERFAWQRRTFDALRRFATETVRIEPQQGHP